MKKKIGFILNIVKIPVVSLDHLLEMKKNSFRPQDIRDTFWLRKIKEKQGKV